jgi:hypothetical protein
MKNVSRRQFCQSSSLWLAALHVRAAAQTLRALQHQVIEWSLTSQKSYGDPFNEIDLDAIVTGPDGREQRVPAFWAGEQTWRIRYAPGVSGTYRYRTVCSDMANTDLHDRTGTLDVAAYAGENLLYRHGPVNIAPDRRHFQHADGMPFFWLGDTWWMGLCQRLRWPEDFQTLAADRVKKGFTVIQIVAGLYPDMPQFDPRGANEAGYPWEAGFSRMNPSYFDMADLRIRYLVSQGLVPCIVGCWGYYLPILGEKRMQQHWRYIVARWGAYPVIWCLAGEGSMPYYLSANKEHDKALQKSGWTGMARYLRSIDPYKHPITIHPSDTARNTVDDPAVLDFDMLQTGHSDRMSIPNTVRRVTESLQQLPQMPVINGEVCYEGIAEASRQEVQRFMFWACMLSGAAGHTYGANGIWQVNTLEKPYGPSPHGRSWGDTPWQEAYQLPGSRQLGLAKALLVRYDWWKLEPHPEWVEPHWTAENYLLPFAAGIPGQLRVLFVPTRWDQPKVKGIESGVDYRAFFFNPATGKETEIGRVTADTNGDWQIPTAPIYQDWVVVIEKVKS